MKSGGGVLLIWNDIVQGREAAFRAWHDGEHIPERVGIPGFLCGRRLYGPAASPRWLTLYEATDVGVFSSPAYIARLDAPTGLTRDILPSFRATQRMAGRVVSAAGTGRGEAVATTRIWLKAATAGPPPIDELDRLVPMLADLPQVAAAAVAVADAAGSQKATAERHLRPPDERTPDLVLIVEGSFDHASQPRDFAPRALLAAADRIASDLYRLEFGLAAPDQERA